MVVAGGGWPPGAGLPPRHLRGPNRAHGREHRAYHRQIGDDGSLDNALLLFLSDSGCSAERGMFGYRWQENRIANVAQWRTQSGRFGSQGQAWANASNAPFRLFKRWVHEGGISTPLIAHWPQRIHRPGRLSHRVGHMVDIMATCCEAAGAPYPDSHRGKPVKALRGQSLLPAIISDASPAPRTLYWEHEQHAAIRTDRWKLVSLNAADASQWRLYDIEQDRAELHDLSAGQPDRVKAMTGQWHTWARETNVLPWPKDRPR